MDYSSSGAASDHLMSSTMSVTESDVESGTSPEQQMTYEQTESPHGNYSPFQDES